MKNIIIIIGRSGSGKTTLQKELVRMDSFKRIQSHTTREKRYGEDDDAYSFTDLIHFEKMEKEGKFIETTTFDNNKYGVSVSALNALTDNSIGVLVMEPQGALSVQRLAKAQNIEVTTVYLNVDKETSIDNLKKDSRNNASRIKNDDIQERMSIMKKEGLLVDLEVQGQKPLEDIIIDILDEILKKRISSKC